MCKIYKIIANMLRNIRFIKQLHTLVVPKTQFMQILSKVMSFLAIEENSNKLSEYHSRTLAFW